MKLQIDGQWVDLTPLAEFRIRYQLPERFGLPLFEPKDYTGLARLDQSGDALQRLQRATLAAVPALLQQHQLFPVLARIQHAFATALHDVNTSVGLRPPEIDFAVSGFGDLCQNLGYELMRLHALRRPSSDDLAETVYRHWLNSSCRLSTEQHPYQHDHHRWIVQVLNTVYGRVGLKVVTEQGDIHYIQDMRYACPADSFMFRLFILTSNALMQALRGANVTES